MIWENIYRLFINDNGSFAAIPPFSNDGCHVLSVTQYLDIVKQYDICLLVNDQVATPVRMSERFKS